MLAALRHRGPDDEGTWGEAGVWLGQRRLAIIDLSPAGHQPMVSACGRYVLTLNGEIYNHHALRRRLDRSGPTAWRGHSDTEVLLELVARHGIEEALVAAEGMFALAVWDRRDRVAWLARDRFGEKPLYYGQAGGGLAFASEISALEKVPGLPLDPRARRSGTISASVMCRRRSPSTRVSKSWRQEACSPGGRRRIPRSSRSGAPPTWSAPASPAG